MSATTSSRSRAPNAPPSAPTRSKRAGVSGRTAPGRRSDPRRKAYPPGRETDRRQGGLSVVRSAPPASPKPSPGAGRPRTGLPARGKRGTSFGAICWIVLLANCFGLVMVLSASSVASLQSGHSAWSVALRQGLWAIAGGAAFLFTCHIDYRKWQKWASLLLVACVAGLMAVLVPHVGIAVDGSRRWLGVSLLRVQPSELAKLAMVLFMADLLTRRAAWVGEWRKVLRPVLIVFAFVAALVLKEPDMGTTLVLGCVVIAMCFAGGVRTRALGSTLSLFVAGALAIGWLAPYRRARLLSFLDPWPHRLGSAYQLVESLVGVSSGHVVGTGLGASTIKWGFLPNPYTDFIFAVIASELGMIGAVATVALYGALAVFGLRAAMAAPDRFGALIAAGITAWLVSQAVINIGVNIGLLPVTGVPLPFVSFGGSSLLVDMAAAGMLANVAAQGRRARGAKATKKEAR